MKRSRNSASSRSREPVTAPDEFTGNLKEDGAAEVAAAVCDARPDRGKCAVARAVAPVMRRSAPNGGVAGEPASEAAVERWTPVREQRREPGEPLVAGQPQVAVECHRHRRG